ncbi:DUF802 domain-containing protein [Xenophilus azovorans]|uniref:DUF802 domain-containing protein n=1 Tax=Xenophilus azovorans TaxID=151755 RepID=UPI00056F0F89|nr:DUF802 domain-containing protein [Xenophilus azovorans]
MNRSLLLIVFLAGLAAVGWVGAGYVGNHALALATIVLIAVVYLAGGLELRRFDQATQALGRVVDATGETPATLAAWLEQVPAPLQGAVRQRVEGERAALPGPALSPYLAGLLVLLGMLGTFMGMVLTLRGTGVALDSATELSAIRNSLSAPVKGLGLAFGTSVAGVAASAMLGLLTALLRRERLRVGQRLDARIATHLRPFSRTHQREAAFELMRRQADALPVLAESLQSLVSSMERQNQSLQERLLASQEAFHGQAESSYRQLAVSVDESLRASLAESARIASAGLQPVVEGAMAGIARESAALNDALTQRVQQQLDALTQRFEATSAEVARTWRGALAEHQRASDALAQQMTAALDGAAGTVEQRSAALVDGIGTQLQGAAAQIAGQWRATLDEHRRAGEQQAAELRQHLAETAAGFERHGADLARTVDEAHARLHERIAQADEARLAAWQAGLGSLAEGLRTQWAEAGAQAGRGQQAIVDALAQRASEDAQRLAAWTQSLDAMAASLRGEWQQAGEQAAAQQQAVMDALARAAQGDEARLAAWTQTLEAMAGGLREQWQQATEAQVQRQQAIVDALAEGTRAVAAQTEAQAKNTLAEIGRLVEAAAEAPRVAAEVVAELRGKLDDSLVRDNTMLEERARILETLSTLLDAVNHASTEQRSAIDALVGTSAELMERVGSRFGEQVQAQAERMGDSAAQISAGAVEVASLGEAFGAAMQQFSETSERLGAQLERIEQALDKSLARSDEQLAYYVAQAREVIDLSVMSQKQIVEDLQQIAARQAAAA